MRHLIGTLVHLLVGHLLLLAAYRDGSRVLFCLRLKEPWQISLF
jgi:hypothetical protein